MKYFLIIIMGAICLHSSQSNAESIKINPVTDITSTCTARIPNIRQTLLGKINSTQITTLDGANHVRYVDPKDVTVSVKSSDKKCVFDIKIGGTLTEQ